MKSNNMRSKPDVDSTGPSWSQCRCGMTLMGAVVSRAKVTRQTAGTEASNKARICGLTICVSPVPAKCTVHGVTTYVGKPSAIGQPTRPTQPFILSGSINE